MKYGVTYNWTVFAFTTATGEPKTGDAANIDAYLRKDGGAWTAVDDAAPDEIDATNQKGFYEFILTATEAQALVSELTVKSATAGVSVIACPFMQSAAVSVNGTGVASSDMVAISGDTDAANALETMLDGTGGNKLTLEQLRINSTSAGGAIDIDNSAGHGISSSSAFVTGAGVYFDGKYGMYLSGTDTALLANGTTTGIYAEGGVADITSNITGNLSGSVNSVTTGVTVTTNNDKTAYSLTQAFPANFSALSISVAGVVAASGNWNTVIPDAAGTAATLIGTLQTHGDTNWSTVVLPAKYSGGFDWSDVINPPAIGTSTFDPATDTVARVTLVDDVTTLDLSNLDAAVSTRATPAQIEALLAPFRPAFPAPEPPLSAGYCSRAHIEHVFGASNVRTWADLDSDGDADKIDARITSVITAVGYEIDSRFRRSLYTLPLQTSDGDVPWVIINIAANFAGVMLYESRGITDFNPDTGAAVHKLAWNKKQAEEAIQSILVNSRQLDAVARVTASTPAPEVI